MCSRCNKALLFKLRYLGLFLFLFLVSNSLSHGVSAVNINMTDNFRYNPEKVTVNKGQTVVWKNTTKLVHTVTADPDKSYTGTGAVLPEGAAPFDSENIQPGEEFKHRFTVAGRYKYFCIPHEGAEMIGEIIVE